MRICCLCKELKPLDQFAKCKTRKLGRAYECKRCFLTKYRNKHYQENKVVYKQRAIEKRKAARDYILNIKNNSKCVQCGQSHPATLDFHHRETLSKDFSIAEASSLGFTIKRLQEEINKCDILCANCHRIVHWNLINNVASVV